MKHERATITFLAYIIGFTTAFIGFGIDYSSQATTPASSVQTTAKESVDTISLIKNSEGLFVNMDGTKRVLSAQVIGAVQQHGYHKDIVSSAVSNSGRYVYYCALHEVDAEFCVQYIYDTEVDATHLVKREGSTAQLLKEPANAQAVWEGDLLNIQSFVSINSQTPWIVIPK